MASRDREPTVFACASVRHLSHCSPLVVSIFSCSSAFISSPEIELLGSGNTGGALLAPVRGELDGA